MEQPIEVPTALDIVAKNLVASIETIDDTVSFFKAGLDSLTDEDKQTVLNSLLEMI